MSEKIKIIVDAMGSDFAPLSEISGCIEALKDAELGADISITFIGDEKIIRDCAKSNNLDISPFAIIHAEDRVLMDDDPATVIKKKPNSSLVQGVKIVKDGGAQAFLSSGNTGAVMSSSTLLLGRIHGVSRPTMGSFFPSEKSTPTLVVDVGANIDCKARFLYEFAVMGEIYYSCVFKNKRPTIGLLNIGEEDSKGGEVVHEAFKMLKESPLNFIGNVEGRDILKGTCDVVICDGFTGNIVLKFAESVLGLLKAKIKQYADLGIGNKIKALSAKPALKGALLDLDYQKYGGVPLLGVNGTVIIGHGNQLRSLSKV